MSDKHYGVYRGICKQNEDPDGYKRIKLKDIKQSNCVDYKSSRKKLSETFISEGYNPRIGFISVGLDNKILNGNHRYCLLLKKYGGEHSIIVRKKMITYGVINFITTLVFLILLPIIFPYYMIKDYYN